MSINYKGNFINQLYKAIEENPDLTIGEILFSFLREPALGKHYFYSTDEDIYNSLIKLNKKPKEDEDVPLKEKDFIFWVGKKVYSLTDDELEKIIAVEDKKEKNDKQGFMFALEQFTIIKK